MVGPNALSPFMQGRSMGVTRPYTPIQSGGQMSTEALMAYNNANALRPTQTQGRNNTLVNVDPAFDIRANSEANRMDLREKMSQDASMARELSRQEHGASEGVLNRAAQQDATNAQMAHTQAMQDAMLTFRGQEGQAGRTHEKGLQDDAIASREKIALDETAKRLELAGLNNTAAKELAGIRGSWSRATNWDSVNANYQQGMARIKAMEKDTDNRNERAKEQLEWEKKVYGWDYHHEKAKYDDSEKGRKEFAKTAGQVWKEYQDWTNPPAGGGKSGMQRFRDDANKWWFENEGLGHVIRINQTTGGTGAALKKLDSAGQEVFVEPTIKDANGNSKPNPEWIRMAKQLVLSDPNGAIAWTQSVDQRVKDRDTAMLQNLVRFQGAAANAGIGIQTPGSSSATPLIPSGGPNAQGNPPPSSGGPPNPALQKWKRRQFLLNKKNASQAPTP